MILFLILGLVATSPIQHQLAQLSLLQTPKEDVLNQLDEILNELQKDQALDDSTNAQTLAKFEAEIIILTTQLEVKQNQLKSTNTLIGDLIDEITTISKTAANLQSQLTGLGQRDTDLRNTLTEEQASFDKNSQQSRQSVNALTEIINKLTNAVLSTSFIQKEEIVKQMQQDLGEKHPLTLLVQVTAKFDKDTVKNIIQKLEHILQQQEESLIKDEQNWESSQQTYQTLLNELTEVRKRLSFDLTQTSTQLNKKNNELVSAQKRSSSLQIEIPQMTQLLANTQNQRQAYTSSYENRKSKRHSEIEVLKNAHSILAAKLK